MFQIGQWVCLNPLFLNDHTVDTQKGVVIEVEDHFRKGQIVTVDWEKDRTNDGGPWHSCWLLLV